MAVLDTETILATTENSKVFMSWNFPHGTAGLNRKFIEAAPAGVYRGFKVSKGPGDWELLVDVDPDMNDSVMIHENASGYTTTTRLAEFLSLVGVDPGGAAKTWYVIGVVEYTVNVATTAEIRLQDTPPVGRQVLIQKIVIPAGALSLAEATIEDDFDSVGYPIHRGKKTFKDDVRFQGKMIGGVSWEGTLGGVVKATGTELDNSHVALLDSSVLGLLSPDPNYVTWNLDGVSSYTWGASTKARFGGRAGAVEASVAHASAGIWASENLQADISLTDRDYTLTCYVYWDSTDSPPDQVNVQVRVSGSAYNAGGHVYQQKLTGADVWHKVVIPFRQQTGDGALTYVRVYDVNLPVKSTKFWVDGFKLERGTVSSSYVDLAVDRQGNAAVGRHLRAEVVHALDGEVRLAGTLAAPGVALVHNTARLRVTNGDLLAPAPATMNAKRLKLHTTNFGGVVDGISVDAEESLVSAENLYGLAGSVFLGGTYAAPTGYLYANGDQSRMELGWLGLPSVLSAKKLKLGAAFGGVAAAYSLEAENAISTSTFLAVGENIRVGSGYPVSGDVRVGANGVNSAGAVQSSTYISGKGLISNDFDAELYGLFFANGGTSYWRVGAVYDPAPDVTKLQIKYLQPGEAEVVFTTNVRVAGLTADTTVYGDSLSSNSVNTGTIAVNTHLYKPGGDPLKVNDSLWVVNDLDVDGQAAIATVLSLGMTITMSGLTGVIDAEDFTAGSHIDLDGSSGRVTGYILKSKSGTMETDDTRFTFAKGVTAADGNIEASVGAIKALAGTIEGRKLWAHADGVLSEGGISVTSGDIALGGGGKISVGGAGYVEAAYHKNTTETDSWRALAPAAWRGEGLWSKVISDVYDGWYNNDFSDGTSQLAIPLYLTHSVKLDGVRVWCELTGDVGLTAKIVRLDHTDGSKSTVAGPTSLVSGTSGTLIGGSDTLNIAVNLEAYSYEAVVTAVAGASGTRKVVGCMAKHPFQILKV